MRYGFSGLLIFLTSSFFAVSDAAAEAKKAVPRGGGILSFVPWIFILGIFYFLLIRPQQKQAKEHKAMIDALKKGDKVLTQGGLYGTVSGVKEGILEVKLNEDVKVSISKTAVSKLVTDEQKEIQKG